MKRVFWVLFTAVLGVHFITAQQMECAAWLAEMITRIDAACSGATRNTVCYGSITLSVVPRSEVRELEFSEPGDIARLADVAALTLAGYDPRVPEWGVALMRVQATLPDILPGQNVAMVLFGDVSVRDVGTRDIPMEAFYLQTGVGATRCREAPESGMLIQTPTGAGRITFAVNNALIELGSTVFIQAIPGEEMVVTLLEGSATVTSGGRAVDLTPGSQAIIRLDESGLAVGEPVGYVPQDDVVFDVPVELLPEAFEAPLLDAVVAPLTYTVQSTSALVAPVTTLVDSTLGTVTDLTTSTVTEIVTAVEPVTEVVTAVVEPVAEVIVPVVEAAAPVVETVVEVVEPIVDVVEPVVEILPTVAPVVEIIPTLLPTIEILPTALPPIIPTNIPIVGGLLNP